MIKEIITTIEKKEIRCFCDKCGTDLTNEIANYGHSIKEQRYNFCADCWRAIVDKAILKAIPQGKQGKHDKGVSDGYR